MKERIRQRAQELGFDDCRFTTAQPPESALHFKRWLSEGQHGEMIYLDRNAHKRIDPQQVLAGAKTIITLAVSYAHAVQGAAEITAQTSIANDQSRLDNPEKLNHRSSGAIAAYARFTDYHQVIGERLKSLTHFVNGAGDETRSLWYVDTGPLLERDLAQRAGTGFIGKHTNLISRRLGNWFFLCEIITTMELEPDESEINHCGTCSQCITACPTSAIKAPFQLDARRCISYLTIELKGAIPLEFRPLVGNRIYGCDDCLAVCPWNRFAREGAMMRPHARTELAEPDLLELLDLNETAFRRRFANTPMLRTKRRGLLRNACVALGNIGGEEALPALQRALNDPEPLIQEHAHWAIERINERRRSATSDTDPALGNAAG